MRKEPRSVSVPSEHLAAINRLIHEPARLAILTALSACEKADFVFLLNVTGLTKGNLSSHLSRLERGGLVRIEKQFEGKLPVTYVMLTPEGREGLDQHWARLDALKQAARALKPPLAS